MAKELTILAAKSLRHLVAIVQEWKGKYHTNEKGDIIFQNKQTYSNVVFTTAAFHTIQQHSMGFENIPETIESPDEIWSYWKDPKEQLIVLRNYLKFGKQNSYLVITRDSKVIDAFTLSNKATKKYRRGVILN